jgi:hypothetical protein
MLYCTVPSRIDPLRLPNLSHLHLEVFELGDQALKVLGGLPELCFLNMPVDSGTATLTGSTAAAHGYFRKLRCLLLPDSTVHFAANNQEEEEEESSVSFTVWDGSYDDAPAFGSRGEHGDCRVAGAGAGAVMAPNLEVLHFHVDVNDLTACRNGSCDNLGLEHLVSLEKVRVGLSCWFADVDAAEKQEAALKHAVQVHPNRPTLKLHSYCEMMQKVVTAGTSYYLAPDHGALVVLIHPISS